MATFISLVNYTDQGIRRVKDSPDRIDAARQAAAGMGVEIKDFYLTMGAYDVIVIFEAPSDEAAAKFTLTVGALGNIRTTTLRAFNEAEFRDLIADLP